MLLYILTVLLEGKMNAAKRFLTATAVTAGVLGAGAGAFFACRQMAPNAQSEAEGVDRRAPDTKYDDGDYDFYFKNGAHVEGNCDGYNSVPSGKTTIYEYFQSDINQWEKRLLAAGVKPEMYRSSNINNYCYARFDTDLLAGIGYEGGGRNDSYNDVADVLFEERKTVLRSRFALSVLCSNTRGFNRPFGDQIDSILPRISEAQKSGTRRQFYSYFHQLVMVLVLFPTA
jgi:hypothetical protein